VATHYIQKRTTFDILARVIAWALFGMSALIVLVIVMAVVSSLVFGSVGE